jgi:hypothetical protein
MDRPRTTVARSETAQWFSRGVLERTGRRWREDAGARLSVIGGPNERSLEAARVVRSGQSRSRHEYPDLTAPLEIAGEIGNYIKLDTDFG